MKNLLTVLVLCVACNTSWALTEDLNKIKLYSDDAVKNCATDEEKIMAIVNFVHNKIKANANPNITPSMKMTIVERLDLGAGWCNHQVEVCMYLAFAQGIRTRMLYLTNYEGTTSPHTIGEAWIGGRWIILDPQNNINLRNSEGKLISLRDIQKDKFILKKAPLLKDREDAFFDMFLNPVMIVLELE